MSAVTVPVMFTAERYVCDACNNGEMVFESTLYGPKLLHTHRCDNCGYRAELVFKYPIITQHVGLLNQSSACRLATKKRKYERRS